MKSLLTEIIKAQMEGNNDNQDRPKIPPAYETEKHLYKKTVEHDKIERTKNHLLVKNSTDVKKSVAFCIDLMYNKQYPNVKISAVSQNMDKAVFIAELLKRKIRNLHQVNTLDTFRYKEIYTPTEADENRYKFEVDRLSTVFAIRLCRQQPSNTKQFGYQTPLESKFVSSRDPREYIKYVLEQAREPKKKELISKTRQGIDNNNWKASSRSENYEPIDDLLTKETDDFMYEIEDEDEEEQSKAYSKYKSRKDDSYKNKSGEKYNKDLGIRENTKSEGKEGNVVDEFDHDYRPKNKYYYKNKYDNQNNQYSSSYRTNDRPHYDRPHYDKPYKYHYDRPRYDQSYKTHYDRPHYEQPYKPYRKFYDKNFGHQEKEGGNEGEGFKKQEFRDYRQEGYRNNYTSYKHSSYHKQYKDYKDEGSSNYKDNTRDGYKYKHYKNEAHQTDSKNQETQENQNQGEQDQTHQRVNHHYNSRGRGYPNHYVDYKKAYYERTRDYNSIPENRVHQLDTGNEPKAPEEHRERVNHYYNNRGRGYKNNFDRPYYSKASDNKYQMEPEEEDEEFYYRRISKAERYQNAEGHTSRKTSRAEQFRYIEKK